MKFSALFTLGLATAAIATPAKRASGATDVIADITEKTQALGSAVSAYSGGDPSSVQSASDTLISTIKSGVESVNGGGDLSSTDALALTSPVQDLTKDVEAVVSDLIDKKSKFEAAGKAGTVLQSLKDQYAAADSLAKAISSKVPAALSDIAAELSSGITAAIQKGIDGYKGATDSEGGSSTTDGGSEPTETAEPTGTAEPTETAEPTATATATGGATTSAPVIPTGSSSSTPSSSAVPSSTGGAAEPSSPAFTGAASKVSFTFGGAVAAAALVAAF
ncbi:hypothetical protein FE257_007923 [Aspergillus nanangensis]|uniref:Cell wall mannoprotein 1 n=1 Tax=Aspergillus nanangensis TaxID=2582783 RepID=A0AAD4CX88_ASPNN|nr:hypothetical protein FE257_007923 [Aspergillus nanangensis]